MTNTNWQWYSGEPTMSHLTQMVGLTVQNFVSAAAGMAVAVAIIRGITRRGRRTLGNFWVDLTRTTLRILLPLSFVVAVAAVWQRRRPEPHRLDGRHRRRRGRRRRPTPRRSPAARSPARIAIKQLGTNGGGFFNANSAHPFENPTGWTNFIELWAILVIPLAFVVTFGILVGSRSRPACCWP